MFLRISLYCYTFLKKLVMLFILPLISSSWMHMTWDVRIIYIKWKWIKYENFLMLQINILFLVRLGKIGRCPIYKWEKEYSIRILESLNCSWEFKKWEIFSKKNKKKKLKLPFIGTKGKIGGIFHCFHIQLFVFIYLYKMKINKIWKFPYAPN